MCTNWPASSWLLCKAVAFSGVHCLCFMWLKENHSVLKTCRYYRRKLWWLGWSVWGAGSLCAWAEGSSWSWAMPCVFCFHANRAEGGMVFPQGPFVVSGIRLTQHTLKFSQAGVRSWGILPLLLFPFLLGHLFVFVKDTLKLTNWHSRSPWAATAQLKATSEQSLEENRGQTGDDKSVCWSW